MSSPDLQMRRLDAGWVLGGILLLVFCGLLAWLSPAFVYGSDMDSRPILTLVALLMAAGAVYLATVARIRPEQPARGLLWWILAVGAGMRLLMAPTQPMLEDDYYRYLWDGALTAHGINPYSIIPADAAADSATVAPEVRALAVEAGIALERVNHPTLGTVYPPVAQAAFTLAHWIAPWGLAGLRLIYFALDGLVLLLVLKIAGHLRQPVTCVAVYWWNPLLVKEVYNSVHMDLLVVPCILAAVLFVLRQRPVPMALALALATAVKIWPLLLVPPALAALKGGTRPRAIALFTCLGFGLLLCAPLYPLLRLGGDSGFVAYGARWEMNDALFMIFPWIIDQLTTIVGWERSAGDLHRAGRVIAAGLVVAVCLASSYAIQQRSAAPCSPEGPAAGAFESGFVGRLGLIAAALFLLSPTQFPWYFLWVLPFFTFRPRSAILVLTVMLPLYYLKFYFDARGQVDFFHYRVVWFEYAPVWLLLLMEWRRSRRNSTPVETQQGS